jgi:glycosyltransferase involved in cell wall biosynthesis
MTKSPLVSIILPVYNRPDYLGEAIESVFKQTYLNWQLIIADDASDEQTRQYLEQYKNNSKVTIIHNPINLGLFANLNQAIQQSNGDYVLLLCSDDLLLENCLENSVTLLNKYGKINLLISRHQTMDQDGKMFESEHKNISAILYKLWLQGNNDLVFTPEIILPLLLKEGSINGNLTGMFFDQQLFNRIGGFIEHWRQIPDWEWVYRAAKNGSIVLSQVPRTIIRSHPETLSGSNFKNFTNSFEVVEMVKILLADPYISQLKDAKKWATHIMQLHLWYAFKALFRGQWRNGVELVVEIHQAVGIHSALLAMIQYLPERWKIYRYQSFPLESSIEMWDDLTKNVRQAKQSGV